MQTQITGSIMPVLELRFGPGEALIVEGEGVAWMTDGFDLETSTRFGSGGQGGFMSGLKRMIGGGQLFLTEYRAPTTGGLLALAAKMPGTIREITIDAGDEFMVHTDSYMASTHDVVVSVGLQKKLGAGILGGAGIVFQKLAGNGTAWVEMSGEVLEYELAAGQAMIIHPAHLALFRNGMELEFTSIKGVKNKLFGDSLLLARLHGPGHVWVQSMTPQKLAAAIEPYLPKQSNSSGS